MKLLPFVLTAVIGLGGVARADELAPVDPYDAPPPPARMHYRRDLPVVRQLLLERFDRNGDGRLEPRERRQAIRALRRLERKLARANARDGRDGGRARLRRLVRRYDLDGDGNVGPGEMPPAVAERLRRFDRDGDGWLDENDLPPRR